MDVYLSVAEVAQILGVSRQRADTITHKPDFPPPAVTVGNVRGWRAEDIHRWAAERRSPAGAAPDPSRGVQG